MRSLTRLAALAGAALPLLAAACRPPRTSPVPIPTPPMVDAHATAETRALYANLRRLAGRQVMFGHQDDLAYGRTWIAEPGRSDVKEVAGSYPALYGWELADLEKGKATNIDGVDFGRMRGWIAEGFRRGGVIEVSFHMNNPVSGGNAWDTTRAVAAILPGGAKHDEYVRVLDRLADFLGTLRAPSPNGGGDVLVPVVFRPFHEMMGGWFWWGAPHTTPDEYKRLWKFTVEYLRDRRSVHNLIYAFSPNSLGALPRERYWDMYPGDDYVDVLGVDDYGTLQYGAFDRPPVEAMTAQLRWLVEQAEARNKVAAITETGLEGIPDSTWYTTKLLAAIKGDSLSRRVAWVMAWRNAHMDAEHAHHFYAPYPGHPSAPDLARFRDDSLIVFESDLPKMYELPR